MADTPGVCLSLVVQSGIQGGSRNGEKSSAAAPNAGTAYWPIKRDRTRSWHNDHVVSRSGQVLITISGVVLAVVALILAAIYQDDSPVEDVAIVGAGTSAAPGQDAAGQTTTSSVVTNPVEGFSCPRAVKPAPAWSRWGSIWPPATAATLTINGIAIPPEEMNVTLGPDGEPTNQITASRSLGQYTFGPEDGCPNARVLRPTNNLLQACVYRLEEGPTICDITEWTFDVL